MGAAERAAAAGDEADGPARQKTEQPPHIRRVLQRDVMVHEDVALLEPGLVPDAMSVRASCRITSRRAECGWTENANSSDGIELGRGAGHRDQQQRVGLTDALPGPVGERRVGDIEDEIGLGLERVQPA